MNPPPSVPEVTNPPKLVPLLEELFVQENKRRRSSFGNFPNYTMPGYLQMPGSVPPTGFMQQQPMQQQHPMMQPPLNLTKAELQLNSTLRLFADHCQLATKSLDIKCSGLVAVLETRAEPLFSEIQALKSGRTRAKRSTDGVMEVIADFFGRLGHTFIYGDLDEQVEELEMSVQKELEQHAAQMNSVNQHENELVSAINRADSLIKEQADKWAMNQDQGMVHREIFGTYLLFTAYIEELQSILERHQ